MTGEVTVAKEDETVAEAAKKLAKDEIGAMPICGDDDRLLGMITDRDIVVKVIAQGRDPAQVRVRELAQGKPVTIGADDPIEEAMETMSEHQVRRLPVIDGHKLIGMVSQADLAKALGKSEAGKMVREISKG